jgi:hypothetical protein
VKRVADHQSAEGALDKAMSVIDLLANEVGPRRPTDRGERLAAALMRRRLLEDGIDARIEPFRGYASFGYPYGLIQAAALLPSLLPPRRRVLRSFVAAVAGAALASEGSLRAPVLSRMLSRRPSANLVAAIEPADPQRIERTLCLMCHLDSSRSGLMFHPDFALLLGRWIALQSLAGAAQALGEPILGGSRRGRRALLAIRSVSALGLAMLLERELRGEDVPGANDNASGCAVAAVLAGEVAASPLASTRLVVLMTGCEEAGTLGAQAFLAEHETRDWLFLNFDNVGGPGPIKFLRREGVLAKWRADEGLISAAQQVADADAELRLQPEDAPAGLTYDTSPVLAAGGRGLTLSVQDGFIPNLHWPTDTYENVDRDGVDRTIRAGRQMIAAVDSGLADR